MGGLNDESRVHIREEEIIQRPQGGSSGITYPRYALE